MTSDVFVEGSTNIKYQISMQKNSWSQWNFVQAGKHTGMGFVPPILLTIFLKVMLRRVPGSYTKGQQIHPHNTNHCLICCRRILENSVTI